MTVAQLLAGMPDGQELAEWAAYFAGEGRVQALVREGTDPQLARRLVWGEPRTGREQ